jgi:hypothetical protein
MAMLFSVPFLTFQRHESRGRDFLNEMDAPGALEPCILSLIGVILMSLNVDVTMPLTKKREIRKKNRV